MKIKQYIFAAAFVSSFLLSFGQSVTQKLDQSFKNLLNLPNLKNGIASIHVLDKNTGNVVYEKNSHIALPTASTLKVITSITALDILGENYQYKTDLYYTGEIDSLGVLHGDIVIQGSGDPTLGSDRYEHTKEHVLLNKWTQAIAEAGIKQIEGRIIGDDRLYNGNDVPGGWIWTDIGNYYGAGISSLNWRENKTGVNFNTGSINSPAVLSNFTSDISYLKVINRVTIGNKGSGDNVYAYSAPYSENIYIKGTYGQDLKKTIEISIPDPAYDLAFQLTKTLNQQEITISQEPTTGQRLVDLDSIFPTKTKELYTHSSPKLSEIVHWFNQKSINLYGEALLRSIGYITAGKTSTADGANFLRKFWEQKLNLNRLQLDLVDGSGLSPQNNITTESMSKIMQYATQRPWYASFVKSLPKINDMNMKSGTINGTLGYTGYQKSKSGKEYTFSILVYHYGGGAPNMRKEMFSVLNNLK